MPLSKIQVVVMDGKIAIEDVECVTFRNFNCEPKSILEVKDVNVYEAEIPIHGVIYDACPD